MNKTYNYVKFILDGGDVLFSRAIKWSVMHSRQMKNKHCCLVRVNFWPNDYKVIQEKSTSILHQFFPVEKLFFPTHHFLKVTERGRNLADETLWFMAETVDFNLWCTDCLLINLLHFITASLITYTGMWNTTLRKSAPMIHCFHINVWLFTPLSSLLEKVVGA